MTARRDLKITNKGEMSEHSRVVSPISKQKIKLLEMSLGNSSLHKNLLLSRRAIPFPCIPEQ